jgi:hypothetical protein
LSDWLLLVLDYAEHLLVRSLLWLLLLLVGARLCMAFLVQLPADRAIYSPTIDQPTTCSSYCA